MTKTKGRPEAPFFSDEAAVSGQHCHRIFQIVLDRGE